MHLPNDPKTILVLAPHTDDGELGAGGSIARWSDAGHVVHYVAFSDCSAGSASSLPVGTLRREVAAATYAVGVQTTRLRVLDFEVRMFARDRQQILQAMVDLNGELSPDLVLMPALEDLHQDHSVIAIEGLRAFKRTSVLSYEVAWNSLSFRSICFVELTDSHVTAKIKAIQCYSSQSDRPYTDAGFLRSQLRYHGVRAGTQYAEAFDVKRWIL